MPSSCIFPSAFFPVSAFSSTFCVSSLLSEALGFPTGNTRVVTVTVLRISFPFASLHSVRFLFLSSLCNVCFVWLFLALLGKFVCDWVSLLVSMAFSGVFYYALGVFRVSVAPLHFLWVVDPFLG